MMKNLNKLFWGILLIILGTIIALNKLEITNINIFFDGWWTLFLIVPSILGIFVTKRISDNLFGLVVGILLLLCAQDIIDYAFFIKLAPSFLLIYIGLKIIKNEISNYKNESHKKVSASNGVEEIAAVLKENKKQFNDEFEGAIIDAVFGHGLLDLSAAKIEKDVSIKANAIFGSIDIIVPKNATIKLISTNIFGTVNKKYLNNKNEDDKIIYVESFTMFGGITIKWQILKKI